MKPQEKEKYTAVYVDDYKAVCCYDNDSCYDDDDDYHNLWDDGDDMEIEPEGYPDDWDW